MIRKKTAMGSLFLLTVSSVALLAQWQPQGKIFAQKLVDETAAQHPELLVLVMHVTPPNSSDNVIIASNIGRIGKKADEDDLRVIHTGKTNLEVNKAGDRFEVELVLQDASGKTIGALGTVFPYKAGDNKADFQKKAEKIRGELRKQIPTAASCSNQPNSISARRHLAASPGRSVGAPASRPPELARWNTTHGESFPTLDRP